MIPIFFRIKLFQVFRSELRDRETVCTNLDGFPIGSRANTDALDSANSQNTSGEVAGIVKGYAPKR